MRHITIGFLVLAWTPFGWAAAEEEIVTPIDDHYSNLARRLQHRGQSFDRIFSSLCQEVLTNAAPRGVDLPLTDRIRACFGGLWIWTRQGGAPVVQGRQDWALHFIGGAAFQGYWDAGRAAAIIKERADAAGIGNRYDLDDLAATMLGARWMDLAVNGSESQARAWLVLWAERKLTIDRSLPPLRFGQMPAGETAAAEMIQEIWQATERELHAPAEDRP